MKKLFLLAITILSLTPFTHSQSNDKSKQNIPTNEIDISKSSDNESLRIEFDVNDNLSNYKAIPIGNDGVIVYYINSVNSKNIIYEFIKLNKNLIEEYRIQHSIPQNMSRPKIGLHKNV